MWKTRFEVSTGSSPNLPRRRRPLVSSPIITPRSSPTVPRVREDSPSAILRPSSSSSIPNLAILIEEEETDHPCTAFVNDEQTTSAFPKQTINKHRFVLPTILESHDHEALSDGRSDTDESNDGKHTTYAVKASDSLRALNTNYYSERKLPTQTEGTGFTINELLQPKQQRKDIAENDTASPTTFEELSAFFENKASSVKATEPKKIVRAKRSLNVNRTGQENNGGKGSIGASTAGQSSVFQRPVKRMKRSHQSPRESAPPDQPVKEAGLTQRWLALLLVTIILLGCTYFSQVAPTHHHQKGERMEHSNTALISCYAQAVRKQFFAFLGQVFFRVEKHEYKQSIIYVLTSIYEHV